MLLMTESTAAVWSCSAVACGDTGVRIGVATRWMPDRLEMYDVGIVIIGRFCGGVRAVTYGCLVRRSPTIGMPYSVAI